jgi:hydrogenase maturation protease
MSVKLLILGYGNSLRRDDGAGLLLAAALAAAWQSAGHAVDLITAHQLMPEHAAEIADCQAQAVLFVDTGINSPHPAATVHLARLDPDTATATLGHHLDPAALLLYAAHLFDAHPIGWLLQVPGYDFDHGEGFSLETQAAVELAVGAADALWTQVTSVPKL